MSDKILSLSVRFHCREKIGRSYSQWDGFVKDIRNYGHYYEILIDSRSGFLFIVGKYTNGYFISIPAFDVGSDLSYYNDFFWNNERLSKLMNKVDAATVAEALRTLCKKGYI